MHTPSLATVGKHVKLAILGDIVVGGTGGILTNKDPADKRSNWEKFGRGALTGVATDLGGTVGLAGGAVIGQGIQHALGQDGAYSHPIGAIAGGAMGLGAGAILAHLVSRYQGPKKPGQK